LVQPRLDAQAPAFLHDEPIEVLDLGAPTAHHILQHRRPATRAPGRLDAAHLRFDLLQPAPFSGVDVALGGDAHRRLDLEAVRPADVDDLGAQVHGDAAHAGLGSTLGGAETAEAGGAVQHAVDGELGPALAPQIRCHFRAGDGVQQLGHAAGALGVATVVLPDLEPDVSRVRAHRDARLVHAGTDRDHAAERALR